MWGDIAIAFLLACLTSFVITPYTIKLAKKVGAIDMPEDRRVNKKPMPRIGGIAVISGFIVSAIYLVITMSLEGKIDLNDTENYKLKLIGFLLGIIVLGIFALLDDIKTLKPIQKLLAQIVSAIIIFAFGIRIEDISGLILPEPVSFILTVGWIVGITNAINLIDGLDGLSSGITLISCIFLLLIFATNDSPVISIVLITALAGAILGFMPYNVNPAKTFIGDVGAQFLGYSLSVIAILGVAKTVTALVLVAPILILGLPIFDTIFAIIRRIIKGKSLKAVFKADRGHLHHRIMKKGYTQKQAVYILYCISATIGLFTVILINDGIWKALSLILITAVMLGIGSKQIKKYNKEMLEENKRKEMLLQETNRENKK